MSGGPGGFGPPSTGDIAIFDSNGAGTCTIAAAVTVQAFDCQGGTGNSCRDDRPQRLYHYHQLLRQWVSSCLGYDLYAFSGHFDRRFHQYQWHGELYSAGHAFAAVTVNGAGGTVQQQDNLSVNAVTRAVLTLTAGTFDSDNAQGIYAYRLPILASCRLINPNIIGAGTITVGGNIASAASIIAGRRVSTGLTFTINDSSSIVVFAPRRQIFYFSFWFFGGTPLTT